MRCGCVYRLITAYFPAPRPPGVSPSNRGLPCPGARVALPESEWEKPEDPQKTEEKQHILGLPAQFNVSSLSNAVPLTSQQKFDPVRTNAANSAFCKPKVMAP
jgi:hypothetical protein